MASITVRPNGHRWIQFVDGNGKRKTLRLGKCNQRNAEAIKVRVEALLAAKISGAAVENNTAQWLAERDDVLYEKLVNAGLACPKATGPTQTVVALGQFVDGYIEKRIPSKKPSTIRHYRQVRRDLADFFGDCRDMSTVTKAEVEDFRLFLQSKLPSSNTVNRRIGRAKQFWLAAIDAELFEKNPFAGQDCQVRANEERFVYVESSTVEKVMLECTDEWQLILALCRFAGLRCPSEVLSLRWGDVNWSENKMLVTAPKTEHHPGNGQRWIPIFVRLRPFLERAFEQAKDGAEFVIERYRDINANLRTQLGRYCKSAGIEMWEKPFQNLRSSAEIDLNQEFPQHVVARWLGHSESIAFKHYLRTTDEHFKKAAGIAKGEAQPEAVNVQSEAKAKHIAKQHNAAPLSNEAQNHKKSRANPGILSFDAAECLSMQNQEVPPQGLEP